jgi:hypothetical protein
MKAARCKNDNEVIIFIDEKGKIYAEPQEHAQADVDFYAGKKDLMVYFDNAQVFGVDSYSLTEGDNWKTPTKQGGTTHYATHQNPTMRDPILVVP